MVNLEKVQNAWLSPEGEWHYHIILDREGVPYDEFLMEYGLHEQAALSIYLSKNKQIKGDLSVFLKYRHVAGDWIEEQGYIKLITMHTIDSVFNHFKPITKEQKEAIFDWCAARKIMFEDARIVNKESEAKN